MIKHAADIGRQLVILLALAFANEMYNYCL
jgi:hypothetical protein